MTNNEYNLITLREMQLLLDLIDKITDDKLRDEIIIKQIQLIMQKYVNYNNIEVDK